MNASYIPGSVLGFRDITADGNLETKISALLELIIQRRETDNKRDE